MIRTYARGLLLLGLAAIFAPLMAAQDAPANQLGATFDLGLVSTGGNTQVTTLNIGEKVEYKTGPWIVTQRFSAVYGRTADSTSTSQWKAGIRGEYQIAPTVGFYALGRYERNRFAGLARRFEEALGVAATLIDGEGPDKLVVEAGASLNQQTSYTTDVTDTFGAGRAAFEYTRAFSEASTIAVGAEALPNFKTSDDYRINGAAVLTAPISQRIALKLSCEVKFDNLPEPGFEKTDRIFTAGLQIVF
jgi:putative salt-induced outer membrane protein YdiY